MSWNFILLSIWQYVFRFVDVIVSWKEYTLSAQMQAILWIIVVTKLTNIQSCRAVSRNIDTFTQSSKTHLALAGVETLSLKLEHGPWFLLKQRQRSLRSIVIYYFFCRSWLVWYELNIVITQCLLRKCYFVNCNPNFFSCASCCLFLILFKKRSALHLT